MLIRLKPWQISVLVAPIAIIVTFILVAAGQQIRAWGLNWIWAVFIFMLLGWRLLSEVSAELEAETAEVTAAAERVAQGTGREDTTAQIKAALTQVLRSSQDDAPVWDDPATFWQHCLALVTSISQIYHPEVKRPLLNIYVPEAYGLIRGTVDDTDRVMQKLSPVLSQVSVGQMVEGV